MVNDIIVNVYRPTPIRLLKVDLAGQVVEERPQSAYRLAVEIHFSQYKSMRRTLLYTLLRPSSLYVPIGKAIVVKIRRGIIHKHG